MHDRVGRRRFSGPARIALGAVGKRTWLADAVVDGGGLVVDLPEAEALVWGDPGQADDLRAALDATPGIHWVQLPWAGVEPLVDVLGHEHLWTCGKGVYADPVAEHVLAMALAGMRHLVAYGRATQWSAQAGTNLMGANVVIVGGGGITESLLHLLAPFRCDVTVVRRDPVPLPGARRALTLNQLDDVLSDADLVVLAVALTPETIGLFDRRRFALMKSTAWLVNVARGGHVVTDDLVRALTDGVIAGAALDVVDPEPLPGDHPLWRSPNCLITPHTANTYEMAVPLLARRVSDNVARFAAGEPLVCIVDIALGY